MIAALIIGLLLLDFVLLGAVIYLGKKRVSDNNEMILEITEERRYLTELRNSIQEDLENSRIQSKDYLNRVTQIATEAELEVKAGGSTLTKEMEVIGGQLANKFEKPLQELAKRQANLDTLLRRVDTEKLLLLKALERGEKLIEFFNKNVPYEDVIEAIKDKKYQDARQLLARGHAPEKVAKELGMNHSEVRMLAGLA
jgi:hypothetical protein